MKPIYRKVRPSVTMSLDQQARALAAAGRDIINLTAGQVDLPMPKAGKDAIRKALEGDKTGYVPATGSPEVKATVRVRMGWGEGEVLISAGAKPLLNAAIACICGPGDEVILPAPCYTSYPEMVRLAVGEPIIVLGDSKNDYIVSGEVIEKHITRQTKAILLNNPVNPTGAVYNRESLRQIVDACIEHDLYLIADEVYSSFVYDEAFVSLYEFSSIRDRLILVNSASKAFAMAGLRLGYAVAPAAVAGVMGGYLSHALGCPCSLSEQRPWRFSPWMTAMKKMCKLFSATDAIRSVRPWLRSTAGMSNGMPGRSICGWMCQHGMTMCFSAKSCYPVRA